MLDIGLTIPIESLEISMGTPTPEQLRLIQNFRPKGTEPYVAEELFTATFSVFDNLIRIDQIASHEPALIEKYSKTLPGKPLGFSHWEGLGARFYYSVVTVNEKPTTLTLNEYGLGPYNRQIVEMDGGHIQAWGSVFMPASSELASQIRYAQASEVSIGPYAREWADRCPGCTCKHPNGIRSNECEWLHPGYLWAYLWYAQTKEEIDAIKKKTAPYVRRSAKVWTASEASIVFEPALPTARAPRHGDKKP